MRSKKVNEENELKEGNISFFEKIKTDKKYSAKVQLIGFGILLIPLIICLNIANIGNSDSTNSTFGDNLDPNFQVGNKEEDTTDLLEKVNDNYRYDITLKVQKNDNVGQEIAEVSQIRYVGKSFSNQIEITKEDNLGSVLYYKVDNLYYSKNDDGMNLIEEENIYDMVDSDYIELDNILSFIDKASLDHVTDYSSGRKEYVYHLKVKDVVVGYKLEDVVEFEIEEENGILKIVVDYTNLLELMDESIMECKLEATITDIDKVEEFVVLEEENASEE